MSKKKTPKGAFHGPAGGFFSQKKKVVLRNLGDNMFSDVNSVFGDEKSVNITGINVGSLLDSAANTSKTKHVNTGAIFGFPLGFPNFVMDNDEDISFLSRLPISLEKKWIDPKIIKTQIEMSAKKSFTLNINLSTVEEKSVMAKIQLIRKFFSSGIIRSMFTSEMSMIKTTLLAREKGIIINSNFKKQRMRSDWAVIIKEILMNTFKNMIITTNGAVTHEKETDIGKIHMSILLSNVEQYQKLWHIAQQYEAIFEDSLPGGLPATMLKKKFDETAKISTNNTHLNKTNHLGFAKFLFQYYCQHLGLTDNHLSAESAFNFYVNKRISYLLGVLVEIDSAKGNFYNKLIQNTSLSTNYNFTAIFTEINKEIEIHTQQKYPITYANKDKEKLQTPAKTKVESPTKPLYHYTLRSAINIILTGASTSHVTSIFE
ncbi:hypothetical protein G9A89_007123 [Geosiphon pyriformis]|nr:hypothetical protein G9A89_007123 [Geosiphon pyriformis]